MYGGLPYAGGPYAGSLVSEADIPTDGNIHTAIEVAFTTAPLSATPAFVDIGGDARWWDTVRGRSGELERFQPGRATVVLDNIDRQYDSLNADGPWYGYLKPNRRIRIRETLNGVTYPQFDGFVDRWQLDYSNLGKDATTTVTATDLFKLLARTDLPRSVYTHEVEADGPSVWWRLDENQALLTDGLALNDGSLGTTGDGTFVGSPVVGGLPLVVNDGGSSIAVHSELTAPGVPVQGVSLPNASLNLLAAPQWSVEAWFRLAAGGAAFAYLWTVSRPADAQQHAVCGYLADPGAPETGRLAFLMFNSAFSLSYGVVTAAGSVLPDQTHHVVCVREASGQLAIYLDGNRVTTKYPAATATSVSGVTLPTTGHIAVGHEDNSSANPLFNWEGDIDEVAVYLSALSETRIDAHYEAGTHPWQGDDGDDRIGRVADIVGIPADMLLLDDGEVTFQSADTQGQTALEHILKVGETEFPQVWVTRDGRLRFMNKTTLFARSPAVIFGDEPGEVGYRAFTPDEGDAYIRNLATISRLQGVAKRATDDDSIDDYGRLEFVLEGLLHDTDAYSQTYANIVVIEYAEQQRRISNLELGPPIPGEEDITWPAMLGLELQDAVTVINRPIGGGDAFEQTCQIDGIRHTSRPGEERTAALTLSPEYVS